jgi:hypothetical protein
MCFPIKNITSFNNLRNLMTSHKVVWFHFTKFRARLGAELFSDRAARAAASASQNSQIGKPYSIALSLFKAGDKHQTLFFPALVSNCSLLHEEILSG